MSKRDNQVVGFRVTIEKIGLEDRLLAQPRLRGVGDALVRIGREKVISVASNA